MATPRDADSCVVDRPEECARSQKNLLPKLEEERRALETKINALVPTRMFDWTDMRDVHIKLSDCLDMNSPHYIVGKKSKNLEKERREK